MPPFRHTMPVRFADVDHAGIVYYAKFFDYFHIAFEEFFRQHLGSRAYLSLLDEDRVGFPLVRSQCDFISPLRFGDTMDVDMSIARLGTKSITFRFRIYRRPGEDEGSALKERVLAAEGENTCAVTDLNLFQAIPMPERLRALLAPLLDTGDSSQQG